MERTETVDFRLQFAFKFASEDLFQQTENSTKLRATIGKWNWLISVIFNSRLLKIIIMSRLLVDCGIQLKISIHRYGMRSISLRMYRFVLLLAIFVVWINGKLWRKQSSKLLIFEFIFGKYVKRTCCGVCLLLFINSSSFHIHIILFVVFANARFFIFVFCFYCMRGQLKPSISVMLTIIVATFCT